MKRFLIGLFVAMVVSFIAFGLSRSQTPALLSGQSAGAHWPRRVLITNDNGIDDVKIIELARAFSRVAETYVVAPLEDRSGSSHYIPPRRKIEVERRHIGDRIVAYGVDGFPAECVVFGIAGLLRDMPPDLVVSGINGGPNLALDWMSSGTVGAARVGSVLGIPAIAVSGLIDRQPESVAAVTEWVVRLSRTRVVREMKQGQYLTVSIPRLKPSEIKGVDVVRRPLLLPLVKARAFKGASDGSTREAWEFEGYELTGTVPKQSDLASYNANRIAIVMMRADENDYQAIEDISKRLSELPGWPPTTEVSK